MINISIENGLFHYFLLNISWISGSSPKVYTLKITSGFYNNISYFEGGRSGVPPSRRYCVVPLTSHLFMFHQGKPIRKNLKERQFTILNIGACQGRSQVGKGGNSPHPSETEKNCCRKMVLFPKALFFVTNFRKK